MPFRVTSVDISDFPSQQAVAGDLNEIGLERTSFEGWLGAFISSTPVTPGLGHQQILARELEDFMSERCRAAGLRLGSRRVSPEMNEQVDLSYSRSGERPFVLVEIEFRPNFEKDLVKFQIAANNGLLALGVLVVATR